jgi:hypothetical protein
MARTCDRVKTTWGACETATRNGEAGKDDGEVELMVNGRSSFKRTKSEIQDISRRRGRRSVPEEAIRRRWKGWCCIFGRILDRLPEAMNNASWGADRALKEVRGSRANSREKNKKQKIHVDSSVMKERGGEKIRGLYIILKRGFLKAFSTNHLYGS